MREALERVRTAIREACARSGRSEDGVRLVAVSKTFPVERIEEALAAGQTLFGENRVQEALDKVAHFGSRAEFHFVGHLQRNKARHAVGRFALIHGVDDARLVRELGKRATAAGVVQPVLLQANLAGEASKSGVAADAMPALLDAALATDGVEPRGLMSIPPPVERAEENRRWFAALRELRDREAARTGADLPELSMGMTDDFPVAVEEGATLVRVGRALFGERG